MDADRRTFLTQILWRSAILLLFAIAILSAACRDVRPVVKIGLIAPFEGLYRRTGYEALTAMRQAIAETPSREMAVVPLALDDSATPERARRAAQKLLVDPQVRSIVGPLAPALTAAVADVLSDAGVPWFVPYAVEPEGGFASALHSIAWADDLLAAVGAAVRRQGAASLALAGDPSGWPAWDEARGSAIAGLPTRFLHDDVASLRPDEAIFWLGAADEAAAFLNATPSAGAGAPFWLGPVGGDPVLTERLETDRKLYWLTWSNSHYTDRVMGRDPMAPAALLTYEATRAALDAAMRTETVPARPWRVAMFVLENGVSRPFTLDE
ncbi:ABC transporter substrate-binding protein [Caldilinea sp.]|uniref:ABC transporter substrate-binding protein n=1 Tax=Caldilinea sp. TaxID=2293560 RepID=UPI0021DD7A74|nr:ABC transporter substrate-binding protein [Caldilinea sp.]GIV67229.1 MAG: hypothetical protein KatS3mg048_0091 [Caldilinea sp.]